jgi:DNA-binding CsgD family transcriptional regulator
MPAARSPQLVGRRAELATALLLLDAAAGGDGRALLVTGEAGIGKSRLVAEVCARAPAAGMAVLTGRAVPGGGAYRPVTEALLRPLRTRPVLDSARLRPFRSALSRLVPLAEAAPAPPEPALDRTVVLGEAVVALLSELGGEHGCVLVLEDLHWADPDTVDLVRYLVAAVAGAPVLLALTARDDSGPSDVARLTAPDLTVLPLARLGPAEVGALAAACRGGTPLPGPELRELVERADGLPLVVEELAVAGSGAAVPATLAGLVAARMAALPGERRAVLVAAAVVVGDPDRALLAEVTAADETAVLAALRAGVEVGLLVADDGRLRWRHALTRTAVLDALLPPERAALAVRTARVLDRRSDPTARAVAAGLHAQAGDPERAAVIRLELARADVRRGALRSAAELLDLAARDGHQEGPVAVERVHVLTLLGRPAEAVEVGDAALAAGSVRGDDHAELCLRLAAAAVTGSRWAVAEAFVERAGRPDDPRSSVLEADAAYGAGDVGRAAALARTAVRAAERAAADPEGAAVLCEALMVLARATFGTDDLAGAQLVSRRAAQVAAEHGLTHWRVAALFGLGSLEHTAGDPRTPALIGARELAVQSGLLTFVVQADVVRSNSVMLVDGPAAALPVARLAAERAERLQLTALQSMAELFAAVDAALVGDLPAMEALLVAAASRPQAPVEAVALAPAVRGIAHLMRHDLVRASALVDEGVSVLLAHGSAVPIEHFGLWALLRTAVGDRDRPARETLRGHHSLGAAVNRAALTHADAIAAGRAGDPDRARALFAEADAIVPQLPWWHRLLRLLALEAAVVDGWGDPVPELRADLAAHEQAGVDQLARTCRDLLRAAGAPTRRRSGAPVPPTLRARGITTREAEVLALVASGLTNAQTAERLFLSVRTVDTHVARLLAKTGSADRTELRRWWGDSLHR